MRNTASTELSAAYPQDTHRADFRMRERPHGLASQPFTGAKQSGALMKSFFQFEEDRPTWFRDMLGLDQTMRFDHVDADVQGLRAFGELQKRPN
jgi:hypothetical protein